jgi:hypothetical protein
VCLAAVSVFGVRADAQRSLLSNTQSVFKIAPYVGYLNYGNLFSMPSGVEFRSDAGLIYGAQAQLDLTRVVAIVGNFGHASSAWRFENLSGANRDLTLDNVGVTLYDANVQVRKAPDPGRSTQLLPFIQTGFGGLRYSTGSDQSSRHASSSVALNAGLGADLQLGAVGFRVLAKDYVASLAWDNAAKRTSNNFALSAGLTFGF